MINIQYSKNATIDDVVKEANQIYEKVQNTIKHYDIDVYDDKQVFALLDDIKQKHEDFCKNYSIIVRFMIQFNMFYSDTFRKFLAYIKRFPWNTEDEYFDRISLYAKWLYRDYGLVNDKHQLQKLQYEFFNSLKSEYNSYKQQVEEIQQQEQATKQQYNTELRSSLKNYIKNNYNN